ncbi:CBS domain-containing protein [Fodinicurvata sp. EGI_FJ10296]|jgi:CBS domain-containing protein|uniref:CBS domain-containing protein n=1 Tax=Fodinicurvata sp. EGI_FJ10296 TaxID=3231908 RepID=UPI003454E151
MTVASILQVKGSAVYSVTPDATVREAAATMAERKVGALLVMDKDERLLGLVSERDFVRVIARQGDIASTVGEVMTAEVYTCAPSDSISDLMHTMTERRIRHLPVMNAGRVVGMVSIGDVVKSRMADIEEEATLLRAYISQ